AAYAAAYRAYFDAHAPRAKEAKTPLDPAPRVIVDPELGVLTAARTAREATAAGEIYRQTIQIIERAERLGGYRALPAQDLFDMEYWELEQAKLKRAGAPPPFAGQVALVTGAASGIGKACVRALVARGAAVIGLDRDPAILDDPQGAPFLGIHGDVTDPESLTTALAYGVDAFGGLDILIANAGIFPP